ncbi:MAG: hypothetical protein HKN72_01980 [Gemmatimonadetes bacterium]|nr:hypothetical protein [Gemmatimonadota bacterium]
MRTFLIALVLFTASPLSAQEWNAEQQDLLDHVTQCWDAWVDALADQTPAAFLAACPWDERGHWWWTAYGAPEPLVSEIQRNWQSIREVDDDWVGLRPIYIDIFGDVGIMHLYGYWRAHTPDGTVTSEMKRTEVFQRRNGTWVLIGAQSAPVTPADAEPYRR